MEQKNQIIEEFWDRFLVAKNIDRETKYLDCFHFELTERLANELLELVLSGVKKATSSSLTTYEKAGESIPKVGDYSIVTDWAGIPRCVIETVAVEIIPYSEMTFDICKREGEDENLESWKTGHRNFFLAEAEEWGYDFTEEMPVIFEDFQVRYQEPEPDQQQISLKKVVYDNVWKIIKLSVNEDQKEFVASNTESILEAYVTVQEGGIALPFGLYCKEKLIGFVMIGYGTTGDEDEPLVASDAYCIWRLMIDKEYQKQGLGKASMEAVLHYIATNPCGPAKYCWLSYEKENVKARNLYASFGFKESGEVCGEEIVAVKELS